MQNEPSFQPVPATQPNNDWLRGIGLLLLLHLVQIPLASMTVGISLIAIGVTQLVYVIPFSIYYKKKARPGVIKGLIIGAAITLLLNGTCTVMFFSNMQGLH